jgi:hypothetical protein
MASSGTGDVGSCGCGRAIDYSNNIVDGVGRRRWLCADFWVLCRIYIHILRGVALSARVALSVQKIFIKPIQRIEELLFPMVAFTGMVGYGAQRIQFKDYRRELLGRFKRSCALRAGIQWWPTAD